MKKEIYTVYTLTADMTFIMCDTYHGENLKTTECVGWYWGEPNEPATAFYTGKLKAEY